MKIKLITLTLLLSFLCFLTTAQDKKVATAKMQEATLFFRGAELTHTAAAVLIKGENEVWIEGLTPSIDINSLKIKTSGGVVVSASEFSIDYLSSAKRSSASIKRLEDSIALCTESLDKVKIDLKINTDMMAMLQAGTAKNVSGSEQGLGIDQLIKTMDYFKSKSEQMQTLQTALSKKKAELDTSIRHLKAQLNQESIKGSKTSGVLKLTLSSPSALTSALTITYFTNAAQWSPYYDINVASPDKPVTIVAKAKVCQTTGLDWNKIKISLSTTTPSNGRVAPLFNTWFLQQVSRAPSRMDAKMAQNSYSYDENIADVVVVAYGTTKKESVAAGYQAPAPERTMDDYVSSADNALNVVYNIDLPYTIPGNGKIQNIELQTKQALADYKYYCAPRMDSETYILAEIADWQKLELLSAPANVTYEGTYVGQTNIDASSTHEKLTLTLSTDKRVSVRREKMQDFSSTKTLGSDIQQILTYQLTVKNNRNTAVKMVLKDQYPISTQKNIEVVLRPQTTPWTVNKEDIGVVTWEETLEAGQTKIYQISYSVKHHKDVTLNL